MNDKVLVNYPAKRDDIIRFYNIRIIDKKPKKRGLGRKDCFLPKGNHYLAEGKGTLRENHQGFPLRNERP